MLVRTALIFCVACLLFSDALVSNPAPSRAARWLTRGTVTPLADLDELWTVNLIETQVTDLEALAGHVELQHLSIRDSPVVSIAPVATLARLLHLSASGTLVTDLFLIFGLRVRPAPVRHRPHTLPAEAIAASGEDRDAEDWSSRQEPLRGSTP